MPGNLRSARWALCGQGKLECGRAPCSVQHAHLQINRNSFNSINNRNDVDNDKTSNNTIKKVGSNKCRNTIKSQAKEPAMVTFKHQHHIINEKSTSATHDLRPAVHAAHSSDR